MSKRKPKIKPYSPATFGRSFSGYNKPTLPELTTIRVSQQMLYFVQKMAHDASFRDKVSRLL